MIISTHFRENSCIGHRGPSFTTTFGRLFTLLMFLANANYVCFLNRTTCDEHWVQNMEQGFQNRFILSRVNSHCVLRHNEEAEPRSEFVYLFNSYALYST